jgi:membrane fusion protein, type I secretion system
LVVRFLRQRAGQGLPNDIDELSPNQAVLLRFSAFNMRTTPELNGKINWIAADQIEDEKTKTAYYLVRIAVPESELTRLRGLKVIPGMPAEAFIQTQSWYCPVLFA